MACICCRIAKISELCFSPLYLRHTMHQRYVPIISAAAHRALLSLVLGCFARSFQASQQVAAAHLISVTNRCTARSSGQEQSTERHDEAAYRYVWAKPLACTTRIVGSWAGSTEAMRNADRYAPSSRRCPKTWGAGDHTTVTTFGGNHVAESGHTHVCCCLATSP